ncbi:MAG: caa(3)-type oxidase, subunit [Spartobacteria bacterium]|nr:caa(3)-type oxidase, subunit [Spartobacteria bacterium]
MQSTTHSPKLYWKLWATLMFLLALTWAIGYVDFGFFNLVIALTIALTKAVLIALFFMHIKGSSRLLHVAAAAGLLWLLIMLTLTLSDYATRN